MIDEWLDIEEEDYGRRKSLFTLDEKDAARVLVEERLIECVRSHYDDLEQITEDVERLGFPGAAAILGERLPRTARARSGEMGEILATEFVEFQTEFRIPIRRLRYKDGRARLGIEVNAVSAVGFRAGTRGSNLLIFFWF